MTTMVEKIAQAILDEIREGGAFVNTNDDDLRYLVLVDGDVDMLAVARAAIEALMEPTPDVEIAVDLHCNFKPWEGDGKRAWQAGIQAALKEGQ